MSRTLVLEEEPINFKKSSIKCAISQVGLKGFYKPKHWIIYFFIHNHSFEHRSFSNHKFNHVMH